MEQYDNILTNQLIFLPASISPFKVIINKVEHCTNVFILNIQQTRMETKEKSVLIILKQSLYHTGIEKKKIFSDLDVRKILRV